MREFSNPYGSTEAAMRSQRGSAVSGFYELLESKPDKIVAKRKIESGPWTPVAAREYVGTIDLVARGLIAAGIEPGDRVALMSATRYEWPILDYAIWSVGAVTVPIYETSSPNQIRWILADSGAKGIIVEHEEHMTRLEEAQGGLPPIQNIWQIEPGATRQAAMDLLARNGAAVDVEERRRRCEALTHSSPATIIYTSGTTGRPKGCVLTHGNFLAESASILDTTFSNFLKNNRSTLIFLPMAHVIARAVTFAAFQAGVVLGHYGHIPTLIEQVGKFHPDFIVVVPRIFETALSKAHGKAHAESRFKGRVFDVAERTAVKWSEAQSKGRIPLRVKLAHWLFGKLVYSKIQEVFGGKCHLAISGGAPLAAHSAHFFNGAGITICEAYGLTETTAAVCSNEPLDNRIGTVGKPMPGHSVRIADDGEILVSGPVVFGQYWENQQGTSDAIRGRWFHTGDLGSIDDDGFVRIVGRKKEIIITAGGKNVAPAVLENVIRAEPLVSQAVCVGDALPFIGALVTIDEEQFSEWKSREGKPGEMTVAELAEDPDLLKIIDRAVQEANKMVSRAESIRKFRILPTDFTMESDELTPTLKVKRKIVHIKRESDIHAIYSTQDSMPIK